MSTDNILSEMHETLRSMDKVQTQTVSDIKALHGRIDRTFNRVDDIIDNIERIEYLIMALLITLILIALTISYFWNKRSAERLMLDEKRSENSTRTIRV